eukprot:m51a1_g7063 putative integral membrane (397) ;mRNA; f:178158-180020
MVTTGLKVLVITGMLVFGTCTVVLQKIIFSLKGVGRNGETHTFEKPWFQTEAMFVGMFGCLAVFEGMNVYRGVQARSHPERSALLDKSVNGGSHSGPSRARQYLIVIAPAMCDLVATAMMNIGLLWINASVWQMLRGSMVIFSAVFSKFFLKRELHASHWVGVATVTFALLVVAFSSLMKPCAKCAGEAAAVSSSFVSSSSSGMEVTTAMEVIGTFLVVFAQIIQASQIVVEEFLLAEVSLPPTLIVGLEGLWGGIVCSLVLVVISWIPTPYGEDTIDTFIMLGKNPSVLLVVLVYSLAILCYNMFGMYVTQVSSAVIRTILEGMRCACIWVTNLFIHYVITKELGEEWTEWSYLQLCGFLFLLLGMFIYNSIVRIDGFYYPPPKTAAPKTDDGDN